MKNNKTKNKSSTLPHSLKTGCLMIFVVVGALAITTVIALAVVGII